jgi:hypothetical protein
MQKAVIEKEAAALRPAKCLGLSPNRELEQAMGERASAEQGKSARRQVLGDALQWVKGDELGVYSAYTGPAKCRSLQAAHNGLCHNAKILLQSSNNPERWAQEVTYICHSPLWTHRGIYLEQSTSFYERCNPVSGKQHPRAGTGKLDLRTGQSMPDCRHPTG